MASRATATSSLVCDSAMAEPAPDILESQVTHRIRINRAIMVSSTKIIKRSLTDKRNPSTPFIGDGHHA